MWEGNIESVGGPEWNKKAKEGQILSLFLSWDVHLFLSSDIRAPGSWDFRLQDLHQWFFGSQVFGVGLGVIPLASLVLRPSDMD